jgi:hypothetical protein
MVFIVLQGYNFHSQRDLRIYGVYTTKALAERAVRAIGTRQAHPVYADLEGANSPVPPTILEIPLNAHPDRTSLRDDCNLRFTNDVGLDSFWTKKEHHDSGHSN